MSSNGYTSNKVYLQGSLFMIQMLLYFMVLLGGSPLLYSVDEMPKPHDPYPLIEHPSIPEDVGPPPFLEEADRFYGEFLKMLILLGVVIGLLLVIMWFFKRVLNSRIDQINSGSMIKILERRSLTPKTALYVIDVEGKKFLIAESHQGGPSISPLSSRRADFDSFEPPQS